MSCMHAFKYLCKPPEEDDEEAKFHSPSLNSDNPASAALSSSSSPSSTSSSLITCSFFTCVPFPFPLAKPAPAVAVSSSPSISIGSTLAGDLFLVDVLRGARGLAVLRCDAAGAGEGEGERDIASFFKLGGWVDASPALSASSSSSRSLLLSIMPFPPFPVLAFLAEEPGLDARPRFLVGVCAGVEPSGARIPSSPAFLRRAFMRDWMQVAGMLGPGGKRLVEDMKSGCTLLGRLKDLFFLSFFLSFFGDEGDFS